MTTTALHARCGIVELTATMRIKNYAGRRINVAVAEGASLANTRSVCVIRTTYTTTFPLI